MKPRFVPPSTANLPQLTTMTYIEIKEQTLAELTKRHEALTQEWDKVKDDASATPAQRVAVLADLHATATQFWTVKKMSAKKVYEMVCAE